MAEKSLAAAADARFIRRCDQIVEWLLYLTFFSVPLFFIILTRDQFELPKLTLLRILTVAMLAVWAARTVVARRFDVRRTPLDLPILVWTGLLLFSTWHSVSHSVSWLGEYENFRGLLTNLNYVALYYLCVTFIRTRVQIDRLLLALMLSGLVMTGYGIAQFFGIDFIAWNPASIAKGRYFSTLGNPNFLAAFLAMVMPLLVIFFLETQSRFRRILLFIGFVSMFFCLMGTWSRGGFLGLVVGLGGVVGFGVHSAYLHFRQRANREHQVLGASLARLASQHRVWLTLTGLTLALLITISATFGRNHMLRTADSIVHFSQAIQHSRLHIWLPAVSIIHDHFWFGTGLDTFKTVFPRYARPDFAAIDGANVASRTAHNEILQVLATQGVVGFIIVGWLTWMILRAWWTAYRNARERGRDRLILVGLLGTWLAYSVQNVFSFGVVSIDIVYWLMIAASVLLQDSPEEQLRRAPSQVPETKPAGLWAALEVVRNLAWAAIFLVTGTLGWQAYKIMLADYAYNLGSLFRMQGMMDASLQEFTRAAELVPGEVKYLVYEALAYEEKAKTVSEPSQQRALIAQAIKAYALGIRLNPTNAYYLGNLGRAYGLAAMLDPEKAEKNFRLAVGYYQQAIEQAPVTVLFYQNLGVLYLSHNDLAALKQVLDKLAGFDRAEASKLAFTAGNTFYNQQQLDSAESFYRQALAWSPEYVEVYYKLGVVLTQKYGPAQGEPLWRRALELKPDFEPARQMLLRYSQHLETRSKNGAILP